MASFYLATTLYTSRARRSKVDNCEMVDQYLTALKELYCTGPDTIHYILHSIAKTHYIPTLWLQNTLHSYTLASLKFKYYIHDSMSILNHITMVQWRHRDSLYSYIGILTGP